MMLSFLLMINFVSIDSTKLQTGSWGKNGQKFLGLGQISPNHKSDIANHKSYIYINTRQKKNDKYDEYRDGYMIEDWFD